MLTITIDAGTFALLLVGLLAGTAAAVMADDNRRGGIYILRNVVIGVAGALVGGLLFEALDLYEDIPAFLMGTITAADILVAFLGAFLLMLVFRRVL